MADVRTFVAKATLALHMGGSWILMQQTLEKYATFDFYGENIYKTASKMQLLIDFYVKNIYKAASKNFSFIQRSVWWLYLTNHWGQVRVCGL
jgi:hypothetical protein